MIEAKVIFTLNGEDLTIQCSKKNKLRDICQKFANKLSLSLSIMLSGKIISKL